MAERIAVGSVNLPGVGFGGERGEPEVRPYDAVLEGLQERLVPFTNSKGVTLELFVEVAPASGEATAAPMKVPGMAVQALAGEIVEALLADENDGGYDLTAGLFGPAFSALVRRWAQAEWRSVAAGGGEGASEPVATMRATLVDGYMSYDVWLSNGTFAVQQPGEYPLYAATPAAVDAQREVSDDEIDALAAQWSESKTAAHLGSGSPVVWVKFNQHRLRLFARAMLAAAPSSQVTEGEAK